MTSHIDRSVAEARFRDVFAHLGEITAYARRRGSHDPDAIAAEAMTIAWRRLADVPTDDARPWLFATARNLLHDERRRRSQLAALADAPERASVELWQPATLDQEVTAALTSLSLADREALLLVAWEDLSPALAARAFGIREATFRVRLHRARRRFKEALARSPAPAEHTSSHQITLEER
ncbi:MAG TPA: sigma-70 family RNA polymerase sigma factor [Gaiellaceae bacterium]|nr:sigma-70 family RNA polymerase sigma factor [Gaiellaceae bacterium]